MMKIFQTEKANGTSRNYLKWNNSVNIYFNETPLKMTKKAFYFILKALFVLKIFKLSP